MQGTILLQEGFHTRQSRGMFLAAVSEAVMLAITYEQVQTSVWVKLSAADSPIDLVYGLGVWWRDGEASRRCLLDHTSAALHHPHLRVAVVLQSVLVTSCQLHLGQRHKIQ